MMLYILRVGVLNIENRKTVKHWFDEWNTRGSVLVWEIKQFFHQGNQTIVEWYFKSKMNNGNVEEFDANIFNCMDTG